jgi:cholesterol oxidase
MYDLTIIGSGYGGSVMAARLSGQAKVLLIERGKRWQAGDFPTTMRGLADIYRTEDNPSGLWAMRLGGGTGNAYANALGGASIINYGITTKPEPDIFDDWPISANEMDRYYDRSAEVLQPKTNPVAAELGDGAFLDLVEPDFRVDLRNTIEWENCTQCGHCVPGCNEDAKRSLDKSYLPIAWNNGIDMELETEVVHIAPLSGQQGYEIVTRPAGGPDRWTKVQTRRLVIAAGTFGTFDLLNKVRHHIPLSPQAFGKGMGMNGDGAAFIYNMDHEISGHHGAPISTTVRIPFVDEQQKTRTLTVMAGRIPFSMIRFSGALMTVLGNARFRTGPRSPTSLWDRFCRSLRDLKAVEASGAVSRTLFYKLDAQDSSQGEIRFNDRGESALHWPDYLKDPIMRFAADKLKEWGKKVGGTLITDPGAWPGMKSYGVHPLGGCQIGQDVDDGVVDSYCRAFKPNGEVYPGLYIVDATSLRGSLGVPSSWTIAAVAERSAEGLQREMASAT